jgi:glycosyltransferase involved in cell wall biosynthesis
MVVSGVHQVLAGAAPRDAITNHALAARQVIAGMGIRSEIFVEGRHLHPALRGIVHPHEEWHRRASAGDVAILHYSIDSPAFADVAASAGGTAIQYHNITPPELLWRYSPALAVQCAGGRRRLGAIMEGALALAADSRFNADEMVALGASDVDVVGILRHPDGTRDMSSPGSARARGSGLRLLFVGRGVPNKAQDDLILTLAGLIHTGVDAHLRLVGSWGGNRGFESRCRWLAKRTGVIDRVAFLGSIDDDALAREYAAADIFACASRHEGYCVPILEAMEAGLPIVARAAGAVPETAGAAALLLNDPKPSEFAEAIAAVASGCLSQAMRQARADQLAHHSPDTTAARLRDFVERLA